LGIKPSKLIFHSLIDAHFNTITFYRAARNADTV